MPLEVRRDNFAVVHGTGSVSRDEFVRAYDEAIRLSGFRPGDPILFDLRNASLVNLTYDDCKAIAIHEKDRRAERGAGRCALVVGAKVDFGVSRMIQAFRELSFEEMQVSVFEDTESATLWLEGDDT